MVKKSKNNQSQPTRLSQIKQILKLCQSSIFLALLPLFLYKSLALLLPVEPLLVSNLFLVKLFKHFNSLQLSFNKGCGVSSGLEKRMTAKGAKSKQSMNTNGAQWRSSDVSLSLYRNLEGFFKFKIVSK